MSPRIGELFAGYGGLGVAVQAVYGGTVAWYSEFDAAPSRIMAHHHPGVPNHGDITAIRWDDVEPVDILTGGFPCQDVSVAGRRAGMRDGTRSGLWAHMRTAIDQLRPGLVVIENVGGLFSAEANRIVEPCDYHMGDADGGGHTVLLRAADAVLGDLATLGYDAEWVALRASDVGAPHGRLRVFITAHPQGEPGSVEHGDGRTAPDARGGGGGGWATGPEPARGDHAPIGPDPRSDRGRNHLRLMPTPRATDGTKGGPNQRGSSGDLMLSSAVAQLLPTPNAALATMGGGRDPEERRSGNHSITLKDAIEGGPGLPSPLIPTPSVADAMGGHERRGGARGDELLLKGLAKEGHLDRFGPYAPVIQRWELVLGRPAPAPTEPGKTRPRLAATFVEFLMGLDDGHVTGVPGLTRNQQLKALGNGVVPLQCEAALAHLHHVREAA